MTMLESRGSEFKDPGAGIWGEVAAAPSSGADPGERGLVLPDEVVADLAAQLVARARAGEPVQLTGQGGRLAGVIAQVLQAGLGLELEEHLAAGGQANGRNGYRAKTVKTEAGPVAISVPRDRDGSFEPVLVPKGARRTAGISDTVISL